MDPGYFANVVYLSPSLSLAVTCDGVGTKVLIAQAMNRYDTVGIDCIAMNVNDLICVGAEPVTFLDYMALQESRENLKVELAKGLFKGATQAGISICGGETAIVPDLIKGKPSYGFDLAGFGIGVVNSAKIVDGKKVRDGDLVIGLHSNGLHSNGYTLARKIVETAGYHYDDSVEEFGGSLGDVLLTPTVIYVSVIKEILSVVGYDETHALVNITGGGLLNLLRVGQHRIAIEHVFDHAPPIFKFLQEVGELSDAEMFNNFNMGIGFCMITPPSCYGEVSAICAKHYIGQSIIGRVSSGRGLEVFSKNLVVEDDLFTHSS